MTKIRRTILSAQDAVLPQLNPSQLRDQARIEDGMKQRRAPDTWFSEIELLSNAFPSWAWAKFRLAYAQLLLEDLDTALDLFEEAQRLVDHPDVAFDEYLASFKAKVEVCGALAA